MKLLALALALLAAPEIQAGKETALFVWSDAKGLHVRWTSEGKPVLVTGSVELDRPYAGEIARTNPLAGGWVDRFGDRVVLYSATSTGGVDGFDLGLATGSVATVDVQLDGTRPEPARVLTTDKRIAATKLPVKLPVR